MKSKINLELKYFCTDFNPVREALKEIGAEKVILKNQKDYFFNLPASGAGKIPGRLKMRIENGKRTLIFYKRPDFSGKAKTKSLVELLDIRNDGLLKFLSKALGVRAVVEKKRELWKKENTVFHLDNVRGVGNIFEIEVWSDSEKIKKDNQKFAEYRKKLLPYLGKIIKGSNEDLVSKNKE
jgi:adenylate cyclase, class 2